MSPVEEESPGAASAGAANIVVLPAIARAAAHGDAPAVGGDDGTWTFGDLLDASSAVAAALLDGTGDLGEARVASLIEPGGRFVAALWGTWRAGGLAVPLALSHPTPELDYVLGDSGADTILVDPLLRERIDGIAAARGIRIIELPADRTGSWPAEAGATALPSVAESRRALMVYTSGTTGRPKGAVHTHRSLRATIETLHEAWGWRADDRTLLVLPLHHVHGLINVLLCSLWAGAYCDTMPKFAAGPTFDRLSRGDLTLFMAVPTVYSRLIAAWDEAPADRRQDFAAACVAMRLMISGSAALPVPTLQRWQEISGHTLLERYGMTEIGMAISNPLHGERRPGHVGQPLPGVEVRLVDEAGSEVQPGVPGEIEVRGANVFLEYWGRPEATAEAFRGGWFRTGDTAVFSDGSYRIMGRNSTDILKVGGYKVSALEIEDVLRGHPAISDCAVVGLDDIEYGQRIGAAVILDDGEEMDPDELRAWSRGEMAPYKVPHVVMFVSSLPRNAMGKVVKPEVSRLFR